MKAGSLWGLLTFTHKQPLSAMKSYAILFRQKPTPEGCNFGLMRLLARGDLMMKGVILISYNYNR